MIKDLIQVNTWKKLFIKLLVDSQFNYALGIIYVYNIDIFSLKNKINFNNPDLLKGVHDTLLHIKENTLNNVFIYEIDNIYPIMTKEILLT